MARPSNKDILTKYRKKIDAAKRWRQEERLDDGWRRMVDLYRGKHVDQYTEEDRLVINKAFATINVVYPSVSVNHPRITVSPRTPEDGDTAVIAETVINYWWRHFGCQKQFRRAVKDFLIMGFGWVKVGYKFVEEEVQNEFVQNDFVDQDFSPETEMVILEDRPFVERISPFDVFVDPDATDMDDLKWIAQRIRRPLKDVKSDKRYNKSARMDAQPTQWSKWGLDNQSPRPARDKDMAYVEVWEYYDLTANTISVFASGSDQFLINPTKMPYSFGHPFVMLRNYEVPEHFYPMGELEAIEPLQQELNATRTQMMNHRKRFSRKWLYKESAFDGDGRSALESDEDNVMVPVISDDPIGAVVAPMPAVINPPELYNQSQLISTDIDIVSGVSEYQRGQMSEIRRTATEAAMLQDASNARSADKLALIEAGIAECARRLVGLAQQFMTGDKVARIVGANQTPIWVTFDRDYIAGEFDFEVEAGSTQPVNESFRRQMALQMVDAMAPFIQLGVVDPMSLARHLLQFGFGIKTPEAFLSGGTQMGQPGQPGLPAGPEAAQFSMGEQEMPQLPQVATGGMPQPTSIPPEMLARLRARTGLVLPNTQGGGELQ